MAIVHGREAAIFVGDTGGVARNLSAFCDSIDTTWERGVADITTFGASATSFTHGLQTNSFSIAGKFDNGGTATPDQYLTGLVQGTVTSTFTIFPNGSATSRPYDTGSAYCTSYKKSIPVDGIVTFSADFQVSGAITRGTV